MGRNCPILIMANTLPNITIPNDEWINIYSISGIESGKKIAVQNIGASDVYLSTALIQPEVGSDNYQVIQPNDIPMANEEGNQGAWAFSSNQQAKISVRIVL